MIFSGDSQGVGVLRDLAATEVLQYAVGMLNSVAIFSSYCASSYCAIKPGLSAMRKLAGNWVLGGCHANSSPKSLSLRL
jgi:hypothetical protein